MSFFQTFRLAMKNIVASKLRSLLTALGIIIGISGVIVIVGMGNGMENYMAESFESMGTDLLTVNIMGTSSSENVGEDDMYALVTENPDYLINVSPSVTVMGSVKIGSETLSSTGVTGVSEAFASMKQYEVGDGRFIQYVDILTRAKGCGVGSYISKEWFGGDAVGQTVRINGTNFTVVGALAEESESEEGGTDDAIYIAYSTAARMSSTGVISSYTFEVASEDNVFGLQGGYRRRAA
jgi:putative ABC transport system permease protein